MFVLLACLCATRLGVLPANAGSLDDSGGATYLITIKDAAGAFSSRGAIALHGDRTVSVIDSGQGGPFFFTSQLGAWGYDHKGGVVGRTVDFDFPPNADLARLDYTFAFGSDGAKVTGTITLTIFPLQGDPLDGDGIAAGKFTFTGELVKP